MCQIPFRHLEGSQGGNEPCCLGIEVGLEPSGGVGGPERHEFYKPGERKYRGSCEGIPGALSVHDLDVVARVKEEYKRRMKVDCTNCRYCMPCPQGVNIPECFNRYNMAFMFDDEKMAKDTYFVFVKDYERASLCVECGACEEVCPQNLPIRQQLKEVVSLFEKNKEEK